MPSRVQLRDDYDAARLRVLAKCSRPEKCSVPFFPSLFHPFEKPGLYHTSGRQHIRGDHV